MKVLIPLKDEELINMTGGIGKWKQGGGGKGLGLLVAIFLIIAHQHGPVVKAPEEFQGQKLVV